MSNPTTTPSAADDIAYVLGLPPDRQSAVFAALVRQLSGDRPEPVIQVTAADGRPVGHFHPHAPDLLAVVAGLSPEEQARMLAPLPDDIDPDDSFTFEELAALRADAAAIPTRSIPATRGGVSTATAAAGTSGR